MRCWRGFTSFFSRRRTSYPSSQLFHHRVCLTETRLRCTFTETPWIAGRTQSSFPRPGTRGLWSIGHPNRFACRTGVPTCLRAPSPPLQAVVEAIVATRSSEDIHHGPCADLPPASFASEALGMPNSPRILHEPSLSLESKDLPSTALAQSARSPVHFETRSTKEFLRVGEGWIYGGVWRERVTASIADERRQCFWCLENRPIHFGETASSSVHIQHYRWVRRVWIQVTRCERLYG